MIPPPSTPRHKQPLRRVLTHFRDERSKIPRGQGSSEANSPPTHGAEPTILIAPLVLSGQQQQHPSPSPRVPASRGGGVAAHVPLKEFSSFWPLFLLPYQMRAKPPLLTQTVVSVVRQVEPVVAGTPVISRDVNTVVHTACIILPFTLIHVCAQRE